MDSASPRGGVAAHVTLRQAVRYDCTHFISFVVPLMGVFVTREHVRHNKSGITHRGKTRISH
jgi:hypothetical protein